MELYPARTNFSSISVPSVGSGARTRFGCSDLKRVGLIAIPIFVCLLVGVYLYYRWTAKKVTRRELDSSKILPNNLFQKASPSPSLCNLKPGGFANGGNTCFIAAALQSLRLVPEVRRRLNAELHSLTTGKGEDPTAFKRRQELQTFIHKLLCTIDNGDPVKGSELAKLQVLLNGVYPSIGLKKSGEIPDKVFYAVNSILDLQSYEVTPCNFQTEELPDELLSRSPYVLVQMIFGPTKIQPSEEKPLFFWERFPEYCIRSHEFSKVYVYSVSSVILEHPKGFHKTTCIKAEGGWYHCNDSQVDFVESVPIIRGDYHETSYTAIYTLKDIKSR